MIPSWLNFAFSYVPVLPKPGETLHGHGFKKGFGGKGANQCVMAARLGAKVSMITKVGKDIFGEETKSNFKVHGIDTTYVLEDPSKPTGVAPITVDDAGQNSIIIVNGANDNLTPADIDHADAVVSRTKVYFDEVEVLVAQYEIRPETTLAAIQAANRHGVFSIFNLAPAKAEIHPDLFLLPDIFCVNETEAEMVSGIPVKNIDDAAVAAQTLQEKQNVKCVIITLGPQVTAVDTAGAGDAFIGALGFFLSTCPEMSLQEAVKKSGAIATITVQLQGTQSSYPTASVLETLETD
eukprot:gene10775-2860_t